MLALLGALLCLSLADDPAFVEGQRLYRAFEYEQAVFRFQEVAVRPELATPDRAEALVWLGLSYAGTGDLEAARRNFKDALALYREVALPPNVSPRVVALFDEEKARVPAVAATPVAPVAAQPTSPPAETPNADVAAPQAAPAAEPAPAAGAPLLVPGAVLSGLGVVALGVGTVMAVLASASYAEAQDPNTFQDDAQAALDRASAEAVAAGVALPVGALLAGGGVAMLAVSLLGE